MGRSVVGSWGVLRTPSPHGFRPFLRSAHRLRGVVPTAGQRPFSPFRAPPGVRSNLEEGGRHRRSRRRGDRRWGVVGGAPPGRFGFGRCLRHPGDRVPPLPRGAAADRVHQRRAGSHAYSIQLVEGAIPIPLPGPLRQGSRATPALRSSSISWTVGASRTGRAGSPLRSSPFARPHLRRSTTTSRRTHRQTPSAPACSHSLRQDGSSILLMACGMTRRPSVGSMSHMASTGTRSTLRHLDRRGRPGGGATSGSGERSSMARCTPTGRILPRSQRSPVPGIHRGSRVETHRGDVRGILAGVQPPEPREVKSRAWLTPAAGSIGVASFLSDVGHEVPTSLLPSFLTATLGAPASALGLIEGIADGVAGVSKLAGGALADDPHRRRTVAIGGYTTTAVLSSADRPGDHTASGGGTTHRSMGGSGDPGPSRNALLADLVPAEAYGRAYGFERMMDNFGADHRAAPGAAARVDRRGSPGDRGRSCLGCSRRSRSPMRRATCSPDRSGAPSVKGCRCDRCCRATWGSSSSAWGPSSSATRPRR